MGRVMPRASLQENVVPAIGRLVRIIRNVLDEEQFLHGLEEVHIGSASALETKVTNRVGPYEILQGRLQQRKRWLKVDAIGCQHNIWMLWDVSWACLSPIVHRRLHFAFKPIE